MTAHDAMNGQQFAWLHGTAHEFQPGDLVDPDFSGRNEGTDRVKQGYAYFTGERHAARFYARQARDKMAGRQVREQGFAERYGRPVRNPLPENEYAKMAARVYEVEPTGEYEADPDNQTLLGDQYPYMSAHPLRGEAACRAPGG